MNPKIQSFLKTNARNWALLAPRLTVGIVMAAHGAQKLFGWFGGYGLEGTAGFFANQLGLTPGVFWAALAGGGEFFGGLLLIIGLATRFAALTVGITMAVAITTVHHGAFFAPAGMEYPLTLLAASSAFLIAGGGALSLDARLSNQN
ncbi:MAG: DoxX family protein [Opitutaceae bacterium]|nr:DoxX family protein [Opitutaceae bacterium]